MEAVVLAGGLGTRLRKLVGDQVPKVMVNLSGKPLLDYTLNFIKGAGISKIVIVVSYKKEVIMNYFGDGSSMGVRISYAFQRNPKGGTADALKCARSEVTGEKFLMVMGDNVFDPRILRELIDKSAKYDGVLCVKEVEDASQYGMVEVKDDLVTKIIEKPEAKAAGLVLTGLQVLPNRIFEALDETSLSPRGEYELTQSIQIMVDRGFRFGYINTDLFWLDPKDDLDLKEAGMFLRSVRCC